MGPTGAEGGEHDSQRGDPVHSLSKRRRCLTGSPSKVMLVRDAGRSRTDWPEGTTLQAVGSPFTISAENVLRAPGRSRTDDRLLTRQMLWPLSYRGMTPPQATRRWWSPARESNPRPPSYQEGALPLSQRGRYPLPGWGSSARGRTSVSRTKTGRAAVTPKRISAWAPWDSNPHLPGKSRWFCAITLEARDDAVVPRTGIEPATS